MKFFLFIILSFLSCTAFAALDEVVISTKEKDCSIHYLTSRTKFNWTIQVDKKNCKNGWVNGYASVQLYSPQKELMETLSGFFNEGYWTDTFSALGQIIERTSPEEHIQSLSFLLEEDKEAEITYIGQLRAIQPTGRPYSSFMGCPDLRILVVTHEKNVFQNIAFQDKIVNQGLKFIRKYCPEPDTLALFGAVSSVHPEIIFQMQVDTVTGDRTIIPISPAPENIRDTKPSEIREEKADLLLSVEPREKVPVVSYHPIHSSFDSKIQKEKTQKDILNHLKILSKIKGEPVSGRAVVHIHQILLDGTGVTDLPEKIQLLYCPNMKTGWAVVEGVLNQEKMQISDIQFCQKEWCTDVP